MNRLRTTWRRLMTIGAYQGETGAQAGKRRIIIGYMVFGQTRWFFAAENFSAGHKGQMNTWLLSGRTRR